MNNDENVQKGIVCADWGPSLLGSMVKRERSNAGLVSQGPNDIQTLHSWLMRTSPTPKGLTLFMWWLTVVCGNGLFILDVSSILQRSNYVLTILSSFLLFPPTTLCSPLILPPTSLPTKHNYQVNALSLRRPELHPPRTAAPAVVPRPSPSLVVSPALSSALSDISEMSSAASSSGGSSNGGGSERGVAEEELHERELTDPFDELQAFFAGESLSDTCSSSAEGKVRGVFLR